MSAVLSQGGTVVKIVSKQCANSIGFGVIAAGKRVFAHKDCGGRVMVHAADDRDASHAAGLISNSVVRYRPMPVGESLHAKRDRAFAAIVCHRACDIWPTQFPLQGISASRIIVLSDSRCEQTLVRFLEDGARHVFNSREPDMLLQVRLEAALRQHRRVSRKPFSVDDIHFDVQKRMVSRAGRPVDLSPKEYEFASRVFSNIDNVVSTSELMTSVWSLPSHMDTRRIDTAACRVRKKLRLCAQGGWELKRIRCVGYRLSRV